MIGSDLDQELVCVGCGCTDDYACEGGCSWVSEDPPICSACAPAEPTVSSGERILYGPNGEVASIVPPVSTGVYR